MAFDEDVADRVRSFLAGRSDLGERHMFGGLNFLLSGPMAVGVVGEERMLRVGPTSYDEVPRRPRLREMDFTGTSLRGLVLVEPAGLRTQRDLTAWIARATRFVDTLPAMAPKRRRT